MIPPLRSPALPLALVCAFAALAVCDATAAGPKKPKRRPAALQAEVPKPDKPVAVGTAQLRLWRASDSPDQFLRIRLLPSTGKVAALAPLIADARNYQFSNYVEVPLGPAIIEVSVPERATVRLPVQLVGGSRVTLLVRAQGGGLGAELIDDTPKRGEAGGDFGIYNLLTAAGGELQLKVGEVLNVHLTSPDGNLRLRGLKRAFYPITITGAEADGKSFRWATEVDFRRCHKATLLIYPDPYGRIRPRLSVDGEAPED